MLIASSQLNVGFTAFLARFEEAVALQAFPHRDRKAPFLPSSLRWSAVIRAFRFEAGG